MSTERPRTRPAGGRRYVPRRKVCAFCADKTAVLDYKSVGRLRRFVGEHSKIEPRRKTGTCARHQRGISQAVKRARHLAMLPAAGQHEFNL